MIMIYAILIHRTVIINIFYINLSIFNNKFHNFQFSIKLAKK